MFKTIRCIKDDFKKSIRLSFMASIIGIPYDVMKLYKQKKHSKAGLYPCDHLAYRIDVFESFCDLIKHCDKYDNSLISQRMQYLEQWILKSKEPEFISSVDKFLGSTGHELKK